MANKITCQSTHCNYARGSSWASNMMQNPVYIGTNSSGSYVYVGQWQMPPLGLSKREIKKITLYIYRNSNYSTYARDEYVGCSGSQSDYASVLSTGVMISLSANAGWKVADVTGLAEYITEYTSTWYLLIGNPNKQNTYVEIAGYGSDKMLYLEIEISNGSKIYLSTNGVLVRHQLYCSKNGALVKHNFHHSENGNLIKY